MGVPGGDGGGAGSGADLRRHHVPALDGLRAIAVLAVIAYHFGLGWAGGGYLGVDLFFVLSGFLITGLLVEERVTTGAISLPAFWGRRARRLFPALLLVLGAVVLYAAVGGPNVDVAGLRGDILGSLFYFANWHFVAAHSSYFAQLAAPSPLEHTWSLAIEEQFYVVWPPVVLVLAKLGGRDWRRFAVVGTIVLATASVLDMALQAHGSLDVSRAYFGTDSRVFELMVGAALALWIENARSLSSRALTRLHGAGVVALGLVVVGFVTLGGPPRWMFDGGFLAITILVAVVVASVARPDHGILGAALSLPAMQWIGRVSYGLYLWHWPVCVFLTGTSTGLPGWAVDVCRLALTFALATASYYLVEQPIRQRRVPGLSAAPGLAVAGGIALALVLVVDVIPVSATVGATGDRNPGSGPNIPGAGGFGAEIPITLPADLLVDRAHPLRVMTIGDSVMQLAQLGIAKALESTGVVTVAQEAFPGFGIAPGAPLNPPASARPWRGAEAFLDGLVRQLHPQLIIANWFEDSASAKAYPGAYRRLLNTVMGALLGPGTGVLGVIFLQSPVIGPIPKFLVPILEHDTPFPGPPFAASLYQSYLLRSAGLPAWNAAVARVPSEFPGKVMFLPVASSLELNGQYTSWLPPAGQPLAARTSWVRVRMRENVHYCPAGITRYAAPVLQDMIELFHLPSATPNWWAARSIVTDTAAGWPLPKWCPNDHPPL